MGGLFLGIFILGGFRIGIENVRILCWVVVFCMFIEVFMSFVYIDCGFLSIWRLAVLFVIFRCCFFIIGLRSLGKGGSINDVKIFFVFLVLVNEVLI